MLVAQCEVLTYGDGSVHGDFWVACSDTAMTVSFNKTQLDQRTNADNSNSRVYDIAWKGNRGVDGCFVNGTGFPGAISGDQISIVAAYPNACGISELQSPDYIYYNSTVVITYGMNTGLIRREEYDYYQVSCLRNRTVEEKAAEYNVTYRTDGKDMKDNRADYSFSLTHTDANGNPKSEYKMGDKIKFDLAFNTAGTTTKAVAQKCWSTSDGSNSEYKLIDNRCSADVGTTKPTSTDKQTNWYTEAYRYLGDANSAVYVECLVRVCLNSDTSDECSFCPARKRRDVDNEESSTGQMAIVKSPVFYIIEKEQPTSSPSSDSALSGTTGTIVIVLLATLVLIVAVAVIKKVFFPSIVAVPTVSMKGIDNNGLA